MNVTSTFSMAVQRHRAGELKEAEALYKQILAQDPRHAPSLHLLGLVALQAGRADLSVELIGQAITIQPNEAEFHLNHGVALDKLGHLEDAVNAYRRSLALKSDYTQALSNLGNALRRQGKYPDAIAMLRRALSVSPDFADAHNNLGLALQASGATNEAIEAFTQAVARSQSAEFMLNLGSALHSAGRLTDAIAIYRRILAKSPLFPEAWRSLGEALRTTGQLDDAAAACRQAVAIRPDMAPAHHELGRVLYQANDLDGAIAAYRAAIQHGDVAEYHNNLAAALYSRGDAETAAAEYRIALAMRPDYAQASNNLGSALKQLEQFDDAAAAFNRALELRPDYAAPHWNLGLLRLLLGDFPGGWPEYEWRWQVRELNPPQIKSPRPRWDGTDLNGRRILLYTEQGFGDAMQFVRYVPLVVKRGGKVILCCQPELLPLLKTVEGVEAAALMDQQTPDFDVHYPLMSLPALFSTTLADIPAAIPYLHPDPEKVQWWNQRLAGDDRLKIGLVWAGLAKHAHDRHRSIAPELLAPLAKTRPARFVSLQKGRPNSPAPQLPMEMDDWTNDLKDFSDTAALVANLDLVITVDTAVAHLAGAMGKPVWVLLQKVPDWRWMLNRSDSPWYPTVRLFRQPTRGDWLRPIAEITEALRSL
jgi:tetratricopeptide (TPR) repeat protein